MIYRSTVAAAFLAAVALLATSVESAQHDIFYNCSQVPFCARLRHAVPEAGKDLFTADINSVKVDGATTTADLSNPNGQKLVLSVTALEGGKYRVTIDEPQSKRYKLEYVLVEEPNAVKELQLIKQEFDYVHVRASENNTFYIRSSDKGFVVEFFHNDKIVSLVDGRRVIFENVQDSVAFTFAVIFFDSEFLLGLPEHAQGIPLLHTADGSQDPYRLKNADSWAYEINSTMSMYGAIPVIYSHGKTTSGIFVHNAAQQWIETDLPNNTAYFMVEGGTLDLFVLMGPTLQETIKQYTSLTGVANLPPQWSIGFQQCRWGYYSEDDVKYVISNFDKGNFSLDVLWLDYNWTNAGRYFEWEPTNFSDPIGLMNWVEETHRKLVILSDPHVKIDADYDFYVGALEKQLFINDSNGDTPYVGTCWPGKSNWLDFLNPATREYYASFYSQEHLKGTKTLAGIWNDMNEPALLETTFEKTVPSNTVQHNGVLHRDVNNIYGLTHTMSTYPGLVARHNGTVRPFILTRSFFAGSQRYAFMWSGDNTADWPYMYVSWPMCMTLNLLGMPFCGADVGGFEGLPPDDMFIRWYQAGAWLPFMRAHSNIGSKRREPYLWSNETQVHLREAIQFRYKHLPIWYTQFYHHTITGEPVIRPVFYNYPEDRNAFNINDEIMLGTDILARAVYEPDVTEVSVYLPGNNEYWYQIQADTNKVFRGNSTYSIPVDISSIPVFYRAGSIIARKETVRQSSTFMQNDPFTLHVMLNMDQTAEGNVYIDDYESFEYRDLKKHYYAKMEYDGSTNHLRFSELDPDQVADDFEIDIESVMVHSIVQDKEGSYSYTVRKLESTGENVPLRQINFKSQNTVKF